MRTKESVNALKREIIATFLAHKVNKAYLCTVI